MSNKISLCTLISLCNAHKLIKDDTYWLYGAFRLKTVSGTGMKINAYAFIYIVYICIFIYHIYPEHRSNESSQF